MKTSFKHLGAVALLGLLTTASVALAQTTSSTTTITTDGTVTDWKPNAVALKVGRSEEPTRYTFTKTTTYTDENGNPISVQTVRSGVPVTVYYEKQGPDFVADRVVIHRAIGTATVAPVETASVTTAPVGTVPTETTTTTTTTVPATPLPPSTNGVVTDLGDSHIDVRGSTSLKPIHYRAHDSTAFVDENGNSVSRDSVSAGSPVTVFFEKDDDGLTATRVVVRNPVILDR